MRSSHSVRDTAPATSIIVPDTRAQLNGLETKAARGAPSTAPVAIERPGDRGRYRLRAAAAQDCEQHPHQHQREANLREQIADYRVNGAPRTPAHVLDLSAAFEQRRARRDPAVGIDHRAYPGVGYPHYRDLGLHRAHRRHREQLVRRRTLAVPRVVRDVDQHVGAALDRAPGEIGKDALVTNQHTEPCALDRKQRLHGARNHVAEAVHDAVDDETEERTHWDVLAEWHQL